jgi:hypothetical protein
MQLQSEYSNHFHDGPELGVALGRERFALTVAPECCNGPVRTALAVRKDACSLQQSPSAWGAYPASFHQQGDKQ